MGDDAQFLPPHTSEALARLNKRLLDTLHPSERDEGRLIPEVTRLFVGEGTVFTLADSEEHAWRLLASGADLRTVVKEDMAFNPAKVPDPMTTSILKYRIAESEAPFARNARAEWMRTTQVGALHVTEDEGELKHPKLAKIPVLGRLWR